MHKIDYIKVAKTARYATYGTISEHTKYFWFALHGSKMVCEQIIKKFKDFDSGEHFVIAPEGLSRLYAKGFGGDVVATWMTSRDRLYEISDFSEYLSALYDNYVPKLPSDCKKVVMGFSQGGTTALRWLHHSPVDVDVFLGYSCWIPEDIDLAAGKTDIKNKKCIYTYGLQDQFLSTERVVMLNSVIAKNGLEVIQESYDGDHRIDTDQLRSIFKAYIS